jgi:hypothetical protein
MKMKLLFVLVAVVLLICSCNVDPYSNLPDMTDEARIVAHVGMASSNGIAAKYNETGSYPGCSVTVIDDGVYFNLSNASIAIDLSSISPSLGTKTVVVTGQEYVVYEAYPEMFPARESYNIWFSYDGKGHTLELSAKLTGASSITVTGVKVDGVSYKPSSFK